MLGQSGRQVGRLADLQLSLLIAKQIGARLFRNLAVYWFSPASASLWTSRFCFIDFASIAGADPVVYRSLKNLLLRFRRRLKILQEGREYFRRSRLKRNSTLV